MLLGLCLRAVAGVRSVSRYSEWTGLPAPEVSPRLCPLNAVSYAEMVDMGLLSSARLLSARLTAAASIHVDMGPP